jgi:DNA topoisomerase-1
MQKDFPGIEKKINVDRKSKEQKTKNKADCMLVISRLGIRPGSDKDTMAKQKAYGASTIEKRHVVIDDDGNMSLQFVGKKGVSLNLPVEDAEIKGMIEGRIKSIGDNDKLFGGVTAKDLLDYCHSLGSGYKTKDFRTHAGTKKAIELVSSIDNPVSAKDRITKIKDVAKRVAKLLGNTPTIALQSYIDPNVFNKWQVA